MTERTRHGDEQKWQVESNADDATAYAALSQDRVWNGYSIADLAPPFRQYAQAVIARGDGGRVAVCLILRHPSFSALVPYGNADGVAAILSAVDLPARANLLAQERHLAAFASHYDLADERQRMLRMATNLVSFKPPRDRSAPVRRLGPDDLPALLDLYSTYEGSAFIPDQLLNGVFYGVRVGGYLLAAGGTHVVAPQYGIGALGNVYTVPCARGRGYASAIAAAVTADLFALSCRDVILNVGAGNVAARRVYHRLGFRVHRRFWEIEVVLRQAYFLRSVDR